MDFMLLALTSLFTMVNPFGVMPVYISMTGSLSAESAARTALKASVTAAATLILFAFLGEFIFNFFGISVDSLRVVGGVIFFMVGFDMLQARLVRTKTDSESVSEFSTDIAITPLAIPMLCGPGAITISIVMMQQTTGIVERLLFLLSIIFVMTITYITLLSSRKIISFIGDKGNKVLMRIMGLIVMVIAVEFFLTGLKPYLIMIIKESIKGGM